MKKTTTKKFVGKLTFSKKEEEKNGSQWTIEIMLSRWVRTFLSVRKQPYVFVCWLWFEIVTLSRSHLPYFTMNVLWIHHARHTQFSRTMHNAIHSDGDRILIFCSHRIKMFCFFRLFVRLFIYSWWYGKHLPVLPIKFMPKPSNECVECESIGRE